MTKLVAETERLVMREWGAGDGDRFFKVMNTPAVMRHLGGVQDRQIWDAAVERLLGYQRDHGHTFWLLERRDDGELLGFCGLKRVNAEGSNIAGEFEIGWRLRESAWGKGYAKEAAIAALDLAFARFGADEVVALTVAENTASWGLMERLSMRRRPELDYADPRYDPPWRDTIVYSIARDA